MSDNAAGETENHVFLRGVLASVPIVRELPSGDELCSFRVTVARPPGGRVRVDSIDCSTTRVAARKAALRCAVGEAIEITGSLHRRFWRSAAGAPASRYEVDVIKARSSRVRRRAAS